MKLFGNVTRSILTKKKNYKILIRKYLIAAIFIFPFSLFAQNDNKAFGDSIFIANAFVGKIFLLPENTDSLPNFDTLKSVATIYTKVIDIPDRDWSTGFPGLPGHFEWFGIEYKADFKANIPGEYSFNLLSDDGSKLFIDGKVIIDNDGIHGASSKTGSIKLDASRHSIKIQYFQGPRYEIALQLFTSINQSKEEIFPGQAFKLYNPGSKCCIVYWCLAFLAIILIIILFLRRKRNREAGNKKLQDK